MIIEDYLKPYLADMRRAREVWTRSEATPAVVRRPVKETQSVFTTEYIAGFEAAEIEVLGKYYNKWLHTKGNGDTLQHLMREHLVTIRTAKQKNGRSVVLWRATPRGQAPFQAWHDMHNAMKAETP